jgi:hypothetical protein
MRILSFLTDPPVVVAILEHLELPHNPPPISPARGPPQGDFLLDQSLLLRQRLSPRLAPTLLPVPCHATNYRAFPPDRALEALSS